MELTTPIGVSDFTPEDASIIDNHAKQLQTVFKENGFQPIKTPTIEYAGSLEHAFGPNLQQQCIEFFDPSGKRLLLRPDHTTPIARTVATRMQSEPLPLKLFYIDPIFRKTHAQYQTDIEIFQAGCEVIGDASPKCIASLIAQATEALKSLGLNNMTIDVGHVDFTNGLSPTKKQALIEGNYLEFGKIPERGKEEIASAHPALNTVYNSLKNNALESALFFNKGLVKGLHYYTGTIFEISVEGIRETVVSGGEYHNLYSQFGYDQPAAGFAINLNALRGKQHD